MKRCPALFSALGPYLIASVLASSSGVVAQGWPLPPTATGNLYISGFSSNNVGEFDKAGNLVRTFSHPTLLNPRGVAVENDGTIVVVVQSASRILRFDPNGNLLQTITHPDLTSGTGISRAPWGDWYVGNFNPGRIVVFDANWSYVTTLTASGMNGVNCVSFDSNGNGDFAVTAAFSNLVYRFDSTHSLIGTVTHPHIGSPMSIADDSAGNHFVSNGSSGWVIKFDAAWNHLLSFGQGVLAAPQGIGVDEEDVLTISNFSAQTVHRYDTNGMLLGSFPLVGVTTGRNLAWQTSKRVLARMGTVGLGQSAVAADVLAVSGQTGDALRRVNLGLAQAFDLSLQAPPAGPTVAPYVVYAVLAEPTLADVTALPLGLGSMAFRPTPLGGSPIVVANSIGATALLGMGVVAAPAAPTTVFSFPLGAGAPLTVTFQAIVADAGSGAAVPWSVSNAVVAVIQ